jgi:transcription elongation GreA/GreB family factor
MILKLKIHHHFQQLVQDRIDIFRDMISALTEDSKNDAKGSAGDKHETALSMMHIEQEKLTAKLKECLDQKAILDKIDATQVHNKAALGSLVTTNKLTVYISTALPKITFENQNIFAISPQSPLAEKLLGNKIGFQFDMNGVQYTILEIE